MGMADIESLRLFWFIFHAEVSLVLFPDGVNKTAGLRLSAGACSWNCIEETSQECF